MNSDYVLFSYLKIENLYDYTFILYIQHALLGKGITAKKSLSNCEYKTQLNGDWSRKLSKQMDLYWNNRKRDEWKSLVESVQKDRNRLQEENQILQEGYCKLYQ